MSTSSQASAEPEASEASKQLTTTSGSPNSESDSAKIKCEWVVKERLDSDLSLLENGAFSDFTVICGGVEWKTHRSILSRCPYFKPMVSENSAFKEARESSITIMGFESFEIDWLLRYIYSLQFEPKEFQSRGPNNSILETCALVWSLGDYFSLPELCARAEKSLSTECKKYYIETRCISSMLHEISFLPDLEAGIRAAWRKDRVAGPARQHLLTVCSGLQPYLQNQHSFLTLLDELPEFTGQLLKALLGCSELTVNSRLRIAVCNNCKSNVFDSDRGEGKQFSEGAFMTTPPSLEIRGGSRMFFCSKDCYNSLCQKDDLKYPEKPVKKA
ncbi:hypothetical protein Daus18300_011178 [Diaporthe australafricana]|uniref:BTB domain-containing protein n=1 Tax=Diaporthe australafricana TaxID=127596 RepID=A0ABR3W7M9_9PEZI